MFMPERNVGITDFAVSRAIIELRQKNEYISAHDMANHIGCEVTAVYRALKRLRDAGTVIKGQGHPMLGGYRWEYVGKD